MESASRAIVALKSKLESVGIRVAEASIREFYNCLRPAEDHVVGAVMFYFKYGIGKNVLETYVNAVKETTSRLQVGEKLKRRIVEILRLEGNTERLPRYASRLIGAGGILQKLGLNVAEVLRETNVERRLGKVTLERSCNGISMLRWLIWYGGAWGGEAVAQLPVATYAVFNFLRGIATR